MATKKLPKRPTIMVSSTVYGLEELLERLAALLTEFGYEVWLSHLGTAPVLSSLSAFSNCIRSVENCDLFLGIITPAYGSGKDGDEISITHQEIIKAIELNKPRWILAHDHVVFARSLLINLGYDTSTKRAELRLKRSRILDDLRVIDMYEAATLDDTALGERKGNWVQKYHGDEEVMRFAVAQFRRFQEVESFLREQLANIDAVRTLVSPKGGAA